jgi:hypothetical protein
MGKRVEKLYNEKKKSYKYSNKRLGLWSLKYHFLQVEVPKSHFVNPKIPKSNPLSLNFFQFKPKALILRTLRQFEPLHFSSNFLRFSSEKVVVQPQFLSISGFMSKLFFGF